MVHRYIYGVSIVFTCPICGNHDERYIGYKNNKPYCRKCIEFKGETVVSKPKQIKASALRLDYSLSRQQKELSSKIVEAFLRHQDVLVYAVTGSGKTEISYGVLQYGMSHGLNVAFAVPRKDVVIELAARLRSAFPGNSIVPIYGGHASILEGDCLVLTTHQLFRYEHYFDLIVMDEVDAFPFKGNDVLEAMFFRSLRGNFVLMSATPSKSLVKGIKDKKGLILTLHTRFHKKEIPVPKITTCPQRFYFLYVIKKLKQYLKEDKPCFVFVPSVELSSELFSLVCSICPYGNYVSSKRENRNQIISDFKKGKYKYLITTAVLERGVTVKNIQVIVVDASSRIYDAAALIQISGRVGRKKDATGGEVIFLANKTSLEMEKAIYEIKRCNSFLQGLL